MRAVLCDAWGEPDSLRVGDTPAPAPNDGQILLDVSAAGVNFADTLMIKGQYQEKPPFPFSPGLEAAGRVAALGRGVSTFKVGDRVLALTEHGAFAEQAIARESDVFAIPDDMPMTLAAGFPITYGTAHGALRWLADIQPDEVLLVHGAAGGVGLAAVEVGKAIGARVIATAGGPDKLEVARAHGADETIDYRSEDIRERVKALTDGRGVDVVFDPVGGSAFEASLRCTAWSGRLLIIGFAGGQVPQIPANILLVKNLAALGFYWGSYKKHAPERLRGQFEELFAWYHEGKLKPHVSHELDLAEAPRALQLLRDRAATGKVVLTTGSDAA